jgi:hypothetical protein
LELKMAGMGRRVAYSQRQWESSESKLTTIKSRPSRKLDVGQKPRDLGRELPVMPSGCMDETRWLWEKIMEAIMLGGYRKDVEYSRNTKLTTRSPRVLVAGESKVELVSK